jgi:hypothetical protein
MVDRRPSEFAGGPGMVQLPQEGNETEVQEVWEVYATNPSAVGPNGDGSENVPTADKVGKVQTWAIPVEEA